MPPFLDRLRLRFAAGYAVDGTTLEAVSASPGVQEVPEAPLAGHLVAAVELVTHLPAQVWYTEDPCTDDKTFLPQLMAWLPCNSLLVFDLGYFAFPFFDRLGAAGSWFVTRLRQKTSLTVQQVLIDRPQVRDQIIHLGRYRLKL